VTIVQKGYGAIKLLGGGEVVQGELTLYAEGWVAVMPVSPTPDDEPRWFPNERIEELVWRKSLATRRPA
jgi:hypothetical protein